MSVHSATTRRATGILAFLAACTVLAAQEASWQRPATRWLDDGPGGTRSPLSVMIDRIRGVPPETEQLVIVGGQTAREWRMQKWFSDFRTQNLAFGASYVTDITHFVEELVLPFEPSTVLMYVGEQDLRDGKSAEQTAEDIEAFVTAVSEAMPSSQFVVVSLVPGPTSSDLGPPMRQTNTLVEAWAASDADVHFVDVTGVTLGSDGRPRPELFSESGERPSELGFLEWSLVTKPVVLEAEARYRMLRACDRWGCGALR